MRNQNLSAILKTHFPAVPQWSIIFLLVMVFGVAQTASAQQPGKISVTVGEAKCNKLKKPVNANVQKTVSRPAIAKASFNPNTEVFCIEGSKEGQARVTFTGTYRGSNNNNNNGGMIGGVQQNGERFSLALDVTVLPPRPVETPDSSIFRVRVNRGQNKDLSIATVLGEGNGIQTREIVLTEGNKQFVRGDLFDNNNLKIRLTGINNGKTNLTLQGEMLKNSRWQSFTRTIEVTVGAGNTPNNEPTDPWLEGMERRLATLKVTARQAGTDEAKLTSSIRNIKDFITLVRAEITKEINRTPTREQRKARLDNLREEANNGLLSVQKRLDEIAKQIRPIGWHDAGNNLKISLDNNARRTFSCPANPQKSYGMIYGTDRYLINSSLCGAAVHAGVITFAGGNVTVEFHDGRKGDKYIGSRRNNVVSESWERNWGSFTFVR